MFDVYNNKARILPMVITLFPLLSLGLVYSFHFESPISAITSIGITSALTFLLSQLGRDEGYLRQDELWKKWGGVPTTQFLRHQNERLDVHTKGRYHQKLQQMCPVILVPDTVFEMSNQAEADQVYRAWTKYLIRKTRDRKVHSLIFKESVSYGFRRNLWGLKKWGIAFSIVLLGANYTVNSHKLNIFIKVKYLIFSKLCFI
jgi:hypothetical protein